MKSVSKNLALETSAFRISVRWPIYIINSVDETKFLYLATLLGTTCCMRLAILLRHVAICCNMLDDAGSILKMVKFFVQHFVCCMMLYSFGHVDATLGPFIPEKISRGVHNTRKELFIQV